MRQGHGADGLFLWHFNQPAIDYDGTRATADGLGAVEAMVLAFTDDVVANGRASDATFDPLRAHLGDGQLLELTFTIGYYQMVCNYLRTTSYETYISVTYIHEVCRKS